MNKLGNTKNRSPKSRQAGMGRQDGPNTKYTYLNFVFGKVESLLDERGQFADATALFSKHRLGSGGKNDDSGLGGESVNL